MVCLVGWSFGAVAGRAAGGLDFDSQVGAAFPLLNVNDVRVLRASETLNPIMLPFLERSVRVSDTTRRAVVANVPIAIGVRRRTLNDYHVLRESLGKSEKLFGRHGHLSGLVAAGVALRHEGILAYLHTASMRIFANVQNYFFGHFSRSAFINSSSFAVVMSLSPMR